MKKLLLLIPLALITLNCSRDDNDEDTSISSNAILPTKITFDGETSTVKYDENKIISIISDVNSGNKIVFTYNGDVITNIKNYYNNKLEVERDFNYSNGKLINESTLETAGSWYYQTSFAYTYVNDNSIKAVKKVSYPQSEYTLNLTYTLSNGVVTNYSGNGNGISNGESTTYQESGIFTYSDKNAIFKNVKGFDKIILNGDDGYEFFSNIKNNILTYKTQSSSKSTNSSSTGWTYYKNTTTYNSENYPVKELKKYYNLDETPTSSSIETNLYEYNR